MDFSMSWMNSVSLALAMLVMASLPSISVFTVILRASQFGFWQGVFTALGIVVADILFIVLALFGLVWLVENVAWLFQFVAYLGGGYLLWLALRLWQSKPLSTQLQNANPSSLASFSLGLSLTFADQKAILFYLGFFPAFLNLNHITHWDAGLVVMLAILAVGLPKIIYAYLAARGFKLLARDKQTLMYKITALLLALIGAFLIIKTTALFFD
ncbi:LysE family translocator [Thiomicrospira microaerophila]|uniref:LysE family translocator n=1 Tax=Thiomicrospira microaerophila TaxID=406020 RepID=UPI00200DD0CB|nr:LysE family translocator [Thiomicrospira microaerophila]UQB41956.1 LysE family translocator [Thiomicrospira microaerophila]